jgi:ABC-type Fe3+-hydroxamate transport system substrate-binding protein
MPVVTDQTGRTVSIPSDPKRIVSLVPSQSELLADLGLDAEVAGITKFCIHPQHWFRTKTRVGGTKQLHMDSIHSLQPDLVLANKEENVKEQVEELAKHYPVWVSDVNTIADAYDMISSIGTLINKTARARKIVSLIKENFAGLSARGSGLLTPDSGLRTCYLIWKNPLMTVGGDTFIHSMLETAGFENLFSDKQRYPGISMEELRTANCELLLLSSEPYPFKQKHVDELQRQLPDTKILLVDGELFSWYGSRMQYAPAYFNQLRHQLK